MLRVVGQVLWKAASEFKTVYLANLACRRGTGKCAPEQQLEK